MWATLNQKRLFLQCVLEYPNLKVLYLHGNGIEKISELDKLSGLKNLRTLTVHGNPIEDEFSGYRHYIIARLPQLKNLDFSAITKQDRASALSWVDLNKTRKGPKFN